MWFRFFAGVSDSLRGIQRALIALYHLVVTEPYQELLRYRAQIAQLRQARDPALHGIGYGAARGFANLWMGILWLLWLVVAAPFFVAKSLWLFVRTLAAGAAWLPFWFWFTVQTGPPWKKGVALGGAAAVIGVGVVGWAAWQRALARGDTSIDAALLKVQLDEAERALNRRLAGVPDDTVAAARLAALRARVGDPRDPIMVRALMLDNLERSRRAEGAGDDRKALAAAADEARKLVEVLPDNWMARCVLATEALLAGKPDDARRHMAALPRLTKEVSDIWPSALLYAAALCCDLRDKDRLADVLAFLFRDVAPFVRNGSVSLSADEILLLADVYCRAATVLDWAPALATYWEPLQGLCAQLPAAEPGVPQLTRMAFLQEYQLGVMVPGFVRRGLVNPEQAKLMAGVIERNLAAVWEAVRTLEPKNPMGYVGEATRRFRAGLAGAATSVLDQGLAVCPDKRPLLVAKTRLLRLSDPKAGLDFVEQSMMQSGSDRLPVLFLLAESAIAAGDREKALDAVRQARRERSDLPWANWMEGTLCLQLGRAAEAVEALRPIRERVVGTPAGIQQWVWALAAAGKTDEAEKAVAEAFADKTRFEPAAAAVTALLQAGRPGPATVWAERLVQRDPENLPARAIFCDALTSAAEVRPGTWDAALGERAIEQYRFIQSKRPGDWFSLNGIVWLTLRVRGKPQEAFEASAPLRLVEDNPNMPPAVLDTLGELYLAVDRPASAVKVMRRAAAAAGAPSAYHLRLARAELAMRETDRARAALDKAKASAATDHDHAEIAAFEAKWPK